MSDLLLELFSEEIPARMQEDALQHLRNALLEALRKEQFSVSEEQAVSFVTPRRLAVRVMGLAEDQPASETEIKGPKIGAPEAALQGFLKKMGLNQSQLIERDGVYFATIRKESRRTAEIVKPLIETILAGFPWPKSMRWGEGSTSWVRPLHNILCLFGEDIVPVQFAGITASNVTYGHRFLSPAAIVVRHAAEYETLLETAHVIPDREKRKASILKQASNIATGKGVALKRDDGLLEEVTGLVEWPVVLMGSIDEAFMELPPEVLTTVMRAHQKYFAFENADATLARHFLIVSNMQASDGGKAIIAGNERVLRARFADAKFFWDHDRKKPLEQWAEGLSAVTFHARLGTIADKVTRIIAIAQQLAHVILSTAKDPSASPQDDELAKHVMRAAELCKADLVTGMVGEFAELQGVMGHYYAAQQQEAQEVAYAIRDHYLPLGPSSPVPTQPISICIALADKLDTLVSMFAIGEKPTGSKDPFALRRAALGIIRIVLENGIRLPLLFVIPRLSRDPDPAIRRDDNKEILAFLTDRLKVQLKDQGIRHDVINAIVADGDDDLVRIVARAKALQDFLKSEDGVNLLVAYRRAANILSIEEKKDNIRYQAEELQDGVLKEPEERALSHLLSQQKILMENLRKNEQFVDAMKQLAKLRQPVDGFFESIMVNCDDKPLRQNRLRLLAAIRDNMDTIAAFALIEG